MSVLFAADGNLWLFELPQREWRRRPDVVGGFREAAVPTVRAARTISRVYLLDIVLRVYESEITMAEEMVAWMQDHPNEPFGFYPIHDEDITVAFSSLLVSPMPGSGNLDFPPSDFPGVAEVSLTLVRADGSSWDLEFYGDMS